MNLTTAITLGISIAGFCGSMIWKVAELSIKYGKLMQTVQQNAERDQEERAHASVKFTELYNRTAAHESNIASLTQAVNGLTSTCSRIETKLDRLIERETK